MAHSYLTMRCCQPGAGAWGEQSLEGRGGERLFPLFIPPSCLLEPDEPHGACPLQAVAITERLSPFAFPLAQPNGAGPPAMVMVRAAKSTALGISATPKRQIDSGKGSSVGPIGDRASPLSPVVGRAMRRRCAGPEAVGCSAREHKQRDRSGSVALCPLLGFGPATTERACRRRELDIGQATRRLIDGLEE